MSLSHIIWRHQAGIHWSQSYISTVSPCYQRKKFIFIFTSILHMEAIIVTPVNIAEQNWKQSINTWQSASNLNWRKDSIFNKWYRENWKSMYTEIIWSTTSHKQDQICQRLIQPKTQKLLDKRQKISCS